jgi:hypothetical protein
MSDAIPTSFDTEMSINTPTLSTSSSSYGMSQIDLVASFKQALSEMKIELDDEVAGKFVNKTVARAIYR